VKKTAKPSKPTLDIDSVLASSLRIIGNEIQKLEAASLGEKELDYNAAMRVESLVRMAINIKRESRNDRLEEQLEDMSEEKLHTLAEEAIKHLRANGPAS